MGVYFLMIIISLFFCSLYRVITIPIGTIKLADKHKKKLDLNIIFIVFSMIPLCLVSGLRYGIGTDFFSYRDIFFQVYNGVEKVDIEVGYYLLNKIISIFTDEPHILFIICSLLMLIPIFKICYSESEDIFMSIFLLVAMGFYCYSFNAVSQYIAIGISFYSYKYIKQRDIKKFIINILIAMLFHKSAMVMIPCYWFLNKKFKIRQYVCIYTTLIVLMPIGEKIRNILIQLIYPIYWNSSRMKFFETKWAITNVIIAIILILGCILLYKKILKQDGKNIININMCFLILIVSTTIPWLGEMGVRLGHYFLIFSILLIPQIISVIKDKYLKVICSMFIYGLFSILFIRILLLSQGTVNYFIPYTSIFDIYT